MARLNTIDVGYAARALVFAPLSREGAGLAWRKHVPMFRLGLGLLVAALVAGCITPNSAYPGQTRYHGVHVDLFFLEWGAPVASHPTKDGGTIYLWFSGRDSAYIPGHTDTELIGNTAWWRGYSGFRHRWFTTSHECGVRIVTTPNKIIREVLLQDSPAGWWQHTRCYEIFGPAVPPRVPN
jgi:hypothetical protein